MKRIDDKIKEIEKKDKINRRLYMGFILLIALFMISILIFANELSKREKIIEEQEVVQTKTYKKLDAAHEKLKKRLRPKEFWEYTEKENSVEGYISYITNEWGITKKKWIAKSIDALNSTSSEGTDFKGWLFVGSKTADGSYSSKDIVEVIYRANAKDDLRNSEIQKGDIVKLTTSENRRTYKYPNNKYKNEEGWRNKTKGFVTDVWKDPNSTDFFIEIKYY